MKTLPRAQVFKKPLKRESQALKILPRRSSFHKCAQAPRTTLKIPNIRSSTIPNAQDSRNPLKREAQPLKHPIPPRPRAPSNLSTTQSRDQLSAKPRRIGRFRCAPPLRLDLPRAQTQMRSREAPNRSRFFLNAQDVQYALKFLSNRSRCPKSAQAPIPNAQVSQ